MKKNVKIFQRTPGSYYLARYYVKVRDAVRGDYTKERTLSTQTSNRELAQKRANDFLKKDIAAFHDNRQAEVNLRNDSPSCGAIVDLYLQHCTIKSATFVARDFLTVVAEGAMIINDSLGVEKARGIKVSLLNGDHMLRWRRQEARRKAGEEPRSESNTNYFMRAAKSVFSEEMILEVYKRLNLPRSIEEWKKVPQLDVSKEVAYEQLDPELLARMDRRARKYFLRLARWFERHGNTRFANIYRNAHAAYWLMRRCGLRNSEVENLRWEWFKPENGNGIWLHLKRRAYWGPKGPTKGSARSGAVPMGQDLYDELLALFGPVRLGEDGFVLAGTKDHRDDGVHRAASKFCRKYMPQDRGKSAYELRKQYGSEMVRLYGLEKACRLLRNGRDTAWKHYVDIVDLKDVKPL